MGITYGDHLIDSGYYDITPEQEREIWAREECARRGIDPDELCADGGIEAWMVVAQEDPSALCVKCQRPLGEHYRRAASACRQFTSFYPDDTRKE